MPFEYEPDGNHWHADDLLDGCSVGGSVVIEECRYEWSAVCYRPIYSGSKGVFARYRKGHCPTLRGAQRSARKAARELVREWNEEWTK